MKPKHSAFSRLDHRPWPAPSDNWTWRQSWHDLLFAHWPVPAAALRHLVPRELEIQEFNGSSWVGVVPFRMSGVSFRCVPDIPWISEFPELNLRLYVERDHKPGVWFLSLDATNPIAIWAARRFFRLPYHHARITMERDREAIIYRSERRVKAGKPVRFQATYEPTSPPYQAQPGTIEHFLTERYCLYAQDRAGILYRCEVHHVPWPLQQAQAKIRWNGLADPHGFELSGPPLLLHFARRLDVVGWREIEC